MLYPWYLVFLYFLTSRWQPTSPDTRLTLEVAGPVISTEVFWVVDHRAKLRKESVILTYVNMI